MRTWMLSLAVIFLVSGCATPRRVQKMIEAGHEKLAEEHFLPEFGRLEELLKELEEKSGALEKQIQSLQVILAEEKQLTASNIGSLSMALNKAQGDMGMIQARIDEVGAILTGQQESIQAAHDRVDTQKDALLSTFRRQQESLSSVIDALEKDGGSAQK